MNSRPTMQNMYTSRARSMRTFIMYQFKTACCGINGSIGDSEHEHPTAGRMAGQRKCGRIGNCNETAFVCDD
eukprot:scaffold269429_cov19-Prasinocladus_malaysianus.AAC.1